MIFNIVITGIQDFGALLIQAKHETILLLHEHCHGVTKATGQHSGMYKYDVRAHRFSDAQSAGEKIEFILGGLGFPSADYRHGID